MEVTGPGAGFLFDHKNGFLRIFDLARAKGVAPIEHLNGLSVPRPVAGTAPARVGRDHAEFKSGQSRRGLVVIDKGHRRS